ncbi:DnaB-like helicase C-terminal domain-containing protein [Streptomyces sp. NPDC050546]|uniref:DnaB-like helicase C-terminal domain-containing protein n=1 Tax=Streptomyces sp. NPDC050546 TaxID=3365628 RepID=UPI00378EFCD2
MTLPDDSEVPEGPHRQMLVRIHDVYALAGRPSYRDMASGVKSDDRAPATLNYQAIGKILKGRKLPSPRQLVSLVTWLSREASASGQDMGNLDEVLAQLQKLREEAHRHALGIQLDSKEAAEDRQSDTTNIPSVVTQGIASERRMLSCMLQSKDAIADVVELVVPIDSVFTDGLHVEIYTALLQLYADGVDITTGSVAQVVGARNSTLTGIRDYVDGLLRERSDPREAESHAERVVRLAKLRRVASMGESFTALAQDASLSAEGHDMDSLVTTVENEVISFMNEMAKISTVSSVLGDALDEMDADTAHGVAPTVPSGFSGLDSLVSGFRPGELTVVAGASGIGKSTLGLDFIRSCSISQRRTSYLVTLQMGRKEMAMRMMAAEARVPLERMRSRTMNDEEWTRLARVMPQVNSAPVWMQDEATYTLSELVQSSRRLSFFNDLQLVVIDSLDLLYVDRRSISLELERDLAVMGRELRNLAKELNVPVVALLQIDQPSMVYDGYARPAMRDIPGSLERFADMVVLLYREDAYEKESIRAGEADLIVAKNRSGRTGTAVVAFQAHYARFVDM